MKIKLRKSKSIPYFLETLITCGCLQVGISKLERLELSSIQIDVIWSVEQSSKRSSFENLTHLDVNGCWKLKYLMSFTMAKSLVNLQSLYVSDCEKMGSIFLLEQDREKDITVRSFV